MRKQLAAVGAFSLLVIAAAPGRNLVSPTPADGHSIHVLAPHVINGHEQGPYHHYCKVISSEPVIECLIYTSTDTMARLTQIEYIVAKTITRTRLISLAEWNRNWHDHAQEIATDACRSSTCRPIRPRVWRISLRRPTASSTTCGLKMLRSPAAAWSSDNRSAT